MNIIKKIIKYIYILCTKLKNNIHDFVCRIVLFYNKLGIYDKLHLAYFNNHRIAFLSILSFIITFFIESMSRLNTSIFSGFMFMVNSPIIFLYNMLIVFSTLAFANLFRKRSFAVFLISIIWIAIGLTNGIVLMQRMTPFTMKDLMNINDGITIFTTYFNKFQIVLVVLGIALVLLTIALVFIKSKKVSLRMSLKKNILIFLIVTLCTLGLTSLLIKENKVQTFFGNLGYAYNDYGVPYCFINTWLNTGIKEPIGYTDSGILKLFNKKDIKNNSIKTELKKGKDLPNIIFVQLESFVDPYDFKNIELSNDPCPYFRYLKENYTSGDFTVPACGAGTANTEFEVLSGIDVKFFGPGEYPYKSILSKKSMESFAYDLKSIGYDTHAIHNHRGTFYNRNIVFGNIGFDTFTSVEYMPYAPRTPKGWCRDSVLTDEICQSLNMSDKKDFIYTISVQGHGKYPEEDCIRYPKVTVGGDVSNSVKNKYQYYVNQIYSMDQFIQNLTEKLSQIDEKVIVVFYGDHIPSLDVKEENYSDGDLYKTEYVMWSNYYMKKENKNIKAYETVSYIQKRLGMKLGTIFSYQEEKKGTTFYKYGLKMLAYDMLYGKQYVYNGEDRFPKQTVQMGIKPFEFKGVIKLGEKYYISGANFNRYTKVTIDGKVIDTKYLGKTLLSIKPKKDIDINSVSITQVDKKTIPLNTNVIYKN